MKVFAVFALLVVAINANLCNKKNANLAEAETYRELIRGGSTTVFGHCASFDIDQILFSGSCQILFDQAFCYGQIAAKHYTSPVTYLKLKGDVNRIQHLGELSCDHARNCINSFASAFQECNKLDAGFADAAIAAAEALYKKELAGKVQEYAASNSDTIVGELLNLVLNRFQSLDDIKAAITEYVTDDIISDAEEAGAAIEAAAVQWCNSNCGEATGNFLKRLFHHMHGGECISASTFCGGCQANALSYFNGKGALRIPCCLDSVIQKSIAGVDYVRETYDDMIEEFKAYLSGQLSQEAVDYATEVRDRVVKELGCVAAVYNANEPEGCPVLD